MQLIYENNRFSDDPVSIVFTRWPSILASSFIHSLAVPLPRWIMKFIPLQHILWEGTSCAKARVSDDLYICIYIYMLLGRWGWHCSLWKYLYSMNINAHLVLVCYSPADDPLREIPSIVASRQISLEFTTPWPEIVSWLPGFSVEWWWLVFQFHCFIFMSITFL